MGWSDHYRRRDIMDTALARARHDEEARIPFDHIDGAREVFGTEENLLLALHHRWTQVLTGHLRTYVAGPEDADDVPGEGSESHGDHVDAVSRAWRAAVRRNPTLHAVVDANVERYPALRRAHQAELRMLAVTSGLAEPHEPHDEAARIGATLVALLRHRDTVRSSNRTTTAERWLRRLGRLASSA
ncbi:hypothetical protein [Saccharomonospora sp.]|uniref:hypothetical protein n=1 Tax=Saccharomonospora sp. TaxID=33913 RepID=UPI002611C429|nr:hypothetical protein [Saccharomonospora sp.]